MGKSIEEQIAELKNALTVQESLRGQVADDVLAIILATLRGQITELEQQYFANEQRRVVTVMFADISGFTSFSEKNDAEDVTETMNRIWERLDGKVLEGGGQIDKHIGDGVMALWGADLAREDNPEQAVMAALAMQNELKQFCAENKIDLSMRIGINTGPVIVGGVGTMGERTVMGDAVNLASRLEKAAAPGSILISHDTFRQVRGVFDVIPQPPLEVKGKSEPVQTYVIERARERIFRLPARGIEGIETRMIGRDEELSRIQQAVELVASGGGAQMLTVVGEAGIGKSRLLYEFDKWLDLSPFDTYYFKGRATLQMRSTPYFLLRDLFAHRFGILESDSVEAVKHKLQSEFGYILTEESQFKAQVIATVLGYDFSQSPLIREICGDVELLRRRALHFMGEYFQKLGQHNPVLIILEDIHWADRPSLAAIRGLLSGYPQLPILFLCLARPALYETEKDWDEILPGQQRIDLRPLDAQQSHVLVREILQRIENLPADLSDLIVRNADGNPFYVEELIKVLLEDDIIQRGEEHWQVDATRLTRLRIPSTLTAVLQARLDNLPPVEKVLLQRASVVGRMFWDDTVELLSNDMASPAVKGHLSALSQRELIHQRHLSAFEGAHEYAFKHAILRDVTYESVLRRERREYHLRVAEWLEQATLRSGRTSEYLDLIATHFEQANEFGKAAEYLSRAAEHAFRLAEFTSAMETVDHAISLVDSSAAFKQQLGMLLVQKGNIYSERGMYVEARTCLEDGLKVARQVRDQKTIAKALGHLGRINNWLGNYELSKQELLEAYEIVQQQGDLAGWIFVSRQLGNVSITSGQHEEAVRYLEESLGLAQNEQDLDSAAAALNSLGENAYAVGEFDPALGFYEQAYELACKVGNRSDMAMIRTNMGMIYLQRDDTLACQRFTSEALELARAIESLWMTASALHVLGTIAIRRGDEKTALAHLHEATRLTRQIGSEAFLTSLLPDYAVILARRGQHEQAIQLIALALAHPACESDTRLEIERILSHWPPESRAQLEETTANPQALLQEIDTLLGL